MANDWDSRGSIREEVADDPPAATSGGLVRASNALDLWIYGSAAAAILVLGLVFVGRGIWESGTLVTKSVLLGVVALGAFVLVSDVQRRRMSLLSKLLVGAWAIIVAALVLLEFLVG